MADWTKAYARALGIKWTPQVDERLQRWQQWEGGHTHNSARNNYMNTKQSMPGSWDAIGNGVQGYPTLAQGALAFARTVSSKNYSPALKQWLATGKGDPSRDLQVWVSGPGGVGSPSAVAYAQKVLGGHSTQPYVGSTKPAPAAPTMSGESVNPMTAVRQTAAQGFADIAQGKAKPTDTMGNLLQTLKTAGEQIGNVTVAIPTSKSQGGGPLESKAANLVKKYLGVQYQWGGESPTGFDCSGLLQYVWKSLGVKIPRTSQEQWNAGRPVDLRNLKPGDAVFTEMGADGPGHVGMYVGNGKIIAAPHTGTVVQVQNLSDWDVAGARRFA
jgi:cell wall-associated NlpC family hydrolase